MAVLRVATCQFPVSADVTGNLGHVLRQIRRAKSIGADVAHFPEGALSGYALVEPDDAFAGFDWDALGPATERVLDEARRLAIWIVLGTAHRLTGGHKPHNSLYVVDDTGQLVDRYDKRFCAGTDGQSGELAWYSPGDHDSMWEINGVRCGALICHEYRYPELHRDYKRHGVELMFHSFHAAGASAGRLAAMAAELGPDLRRLNPAPTFTFPGITMAAAMTAAAAASHLWISCPNSSAPESLWPSFFVRPDGVTTGRLRRNRSGVLLSTVDTEVDQYDSTRSWRDRAIAGTFHSGTPVRDPRSTARKSL